MYKRVLIALTTIIASLPIAGQTSWGKTHHEGEPWVKNISRQHIAEKGLEGHHLSVWASHGRYFDINKGKWCWQRPSLFCTNEDLFTQTIVVPYLIPMLENAGAVVFTPRERDWQKNEVIVDNDDHTSMVAYRENNHKESWTNAPSSGFAQHAGTYSDNENPFTAGTARMAKTTHNRNNQSTVYYQPQIPENGKYAVYVSYQTTPESVDDACYIVCHKGQSTEFRVNQQMGGSTWVYLGTFEFEKGNSERNHVVVSNLSRHKGVVTTDAVRFGGGMGNIQRHNQVSGLPRCLEGARYYAQWAGMPYRVYSTRQGSNDYADDINVRSLSTNLLAGGSCYAPDSIGRKVPIELSLAVHSDAGHTPTGQGIYGTLSICTTHYGDSLLATGMSREASHELASDLLNNTTADLQYRYGQWSKRKLYDRNYSETRLPIVPSSIIETLSHQNFGDMRYGHDPDFKFTLARSIYKTILKYVTSHHREEYIVEPLAPDNFHIEFTNKPGEVRISWQGIIDGQEPSSRPTGYLLYIAQENNGFDNGTPLKGTSCNVKLAPGVLYHFKVMATNDGGRSFPTETLSAIYQPKAAYKAVIINGFHRLSSPAISATGLGFDMNLDPGVSYGKTAGWLGYQQVFDADKIGIEDSTGLGFSGEELAGQIIAGNDFNYVTTHAEALRHDTRFSFVSCSSKAVENGSVKLDHYHVVDLVLGLEKDDGHSLVYYKTLRPTMQAALRKYTNHGGSLLVSGAYIGSDQTTDDEKLMLSELLKCETAGVNTSSAAVRGLGLHFDFYKSLNETHYAATHTDVLLPTSSFSFPAMVYEHDESSAAVAYNGNDYHAFTMGFPFECITDSLARARIMKGIMSFLIK